MAADNLKGYIGDSSGVAFKANNGKYLNMGDHGAKYIFSNQRDKSHITKFRPFVDISGLIMLECNPPNSGLYAEVVSRPLRNIDNTDRFYIECYRIEERYLRKNNKFQAISINNGRQVVLRSELTGKFLRTQTINGKDFMTADAYSLSGVHFISNYQSILQYENFCF